MSLGLEYYKSYTNIASITAFTEYLYENNIDTLLPRFSYMFHSWGWATWKKIWEKFDHLDVKNYTVDKNHKIFENKSLSKSFQRILNLCNKKEIVTWDYQFQNFCFRNNFLNVMPQFPLIINTGLGDELSENCKEFLPVKGSISQAELLELFSYIKIDISKPIDLDLNKEYSIFLKKYPSFKDKLIRKTKNIFA